MPPVGGTNEKIGVDSVLEDATIVSGDDGEIVVVKAVEMASHCGGKVDEFGC